MPILPSKELIKTILGYEGAYNLEDNFFIYAQSDTYDACPDCFTRLPKVSSCARSWKCINPECQNSGDFEFYSPIYNYSTDIRINIYELAHKCKEWAFSKNYSIDIFRNKNGSWYVDIMDYENNSKQVYKNDYLNTEPEAIFKACEWILTQLKQSKDIKCGY